MHDVEQPPTIPDDGAAAAPSPAPATRRGLGLMPGVVALIVTGALLLALVLQNNEEAHLSLLWFDARLPLSALVLGAAVVTIVLDEAIGIVWRRRRRRLLNLQEDRH